MSLVIITGASRGFGKCLAELFVEEHIARSPNVTLEVLLIARDAAKLSETSGRISALPGFSAGPHTVQQLAVDLGCPTSLDSSIEALCQQHEADKYGTVYLFNNAGTIGPLKRAEDLSASEIRQSVELNLVSPAVLTTRFLKHFGQGSAQLVVVNVSSLMAVQAFKDVSTYCMTRAARDMFTACISKDNPAVRALNYAPGPLDTDMQADLRANLPEGEMKAGFAKMHTEGALLTPADSARKCVKLVLDNKFDNGAHVDYYDI